MIKIPLTKHQKRVMAKFHKPNTDVSILEIYLHVYEGRASSRVRSSRGMQMRLAPTFAAINAKLFDPDKDFSPKIIPGKLKRTYRLQTEEE